MSKSDRIRKRQRRGRYAKPSMPRAIGANDNIDTANDNLPLVEVGGVTLNAKMSAAFRQAEQDVASPEIARRREGHQAFVEIEQAIAAEQDAKRMKAVRREIAVLEAQRGYGLTETQLRDKRGQEGVEYRVTRDGLLSIEKLSVPKWSAALRYRVDYERVDPEKKLTPPTLLRESGSKGSDGYAKKVAESWDRIRSVHLMIAGVSVSLDPASRPNMPNLPARHPAMRSITALQEIAGKGRALSDMTSSGSVKARIREDLIRGLSVCEIVYGLD